MQKWKQIDANCVTAQDIFSPYLFALRNKIDIYVVVPVLTKDTMFLQIQMIHCYLPLLVPLCIMADHEKQTRYTQKKINKYREEKKENIY